MLGLYNDKIYPHTNCLLFTNNKVNGIINSLDHLLHNPAHILAEPCHNQRDHATALARILALLLVTAWKPDLIAATEQRD